VGSSGNVSENLSRICFFTYLMRFVDSNRGWRCNSIPFLIVLLASVLPLVLILFWNYRGIQIQVTNNELLISYGFFNHKHIPISNIASCKHTKTPLSKYGGAGVRYRSTDRSWAYTTSFGNAVKIIQRKGKSFVFSSNNPEKLCNIINQIKEKAVNRQS
jgi:hypothetical protein